MNAQRIRHSLLSVLRSIFLPGVFAMMLTVTPVAAANFAPSPRPAASSVRLIQASESFAFPKPPAVEALPVYRETRTADGLQVCGEIRSNTVWTAATGVNNTGGDYVGIAAGLHDMAVDPLFVDAAAGDFHLAAGSPLIDAGDPTQYPPTDFDGDARPLGVGPDVGVDEFRPQPASPSP